KDLFRILQLLPGVQSGSEASAGFYVRGGGPDQNLILLDEAVVYNPFHLGGYMSTFNADAIRSVSLTKGGFPAQYGGRLSSIVDVTMKDGNENEHHGEGGIGIISSRLTLEGPIIKGKSTYMFSGRRTYIDALVRPFFPSGNDAAYYFYDLNGKINYKFSDKDRVFLSSYMGRDVFFVEQKTRDEYTKIQIDWGNKTVTARWNHLFTDKLFANTTFLYNDYNFQIGSTMDNDPADTIKASKASLFSGINDVGGKIDFDWFPSVRNRVKFGAQYTYQQFIPTAVRGESPDIEEFKTQQQKYVHQGGIYINDEYTASPLLAFNFGLRLPFFAYKQTQYYSLEPRITTKYSLDERSSIKAAYTYMNQYIHLISNSTLSLPMDLWIPSSNIVKPQKAHQVAVGYFRNFKNDNYETSVEIYYKDMRNMIEYREGAQIFLNADLDKELVFGKGQSYGSEFFVKKNNGRITGWIGYTLSYANRNFPELNNGKTYPAKYDRRHDFVITGVYNFNKQWSFSTIFVYGSGHSASLPMGTYSIRGMDDGSFGGEFTGQDFVEKNFYKLRAYNRMDIGIKYTKEKKLYSSDWRFDIYNVYSRRNPYFVYLGTERDRNSNIIKPVAKQVSLFPIIPSVSYNLRF
ncbi:MAG: TonB-dependent receptor, partial [Sphingobacteriales bacterium]